MKATLIGMTMAAAVSALAGCAAPCSYIDGNRYFQADINSSSVIVLDVNGRSDTRNPVMVDPGKHVIRVQGPAPGGFRFGEVRTLTLEVKPCTRYYLKAVRQNSLQLDFEPKVDFEEPIAGCTA